MRWRFSRLTASAPPPKAWSWRALTSTNTSVSRSRAMMSNSPPRRRYRRARTEYPRRSSSPHARFSPISPSATLCLDTSVQAARTLPLLDVCQRLVEDADRGLGPLSRQHERWRKSDRVLAGAEEKQPPAERRIDG